MIYIDSQPKPIIYGENLGKIYEGNVEVIALKQATISIEKGKFYAIMGASGSGKTTLLQLLGLLDRPTSGKLLVNGIDTKEIKEADKARLRMETLGFIFQFFHLIPHLKAWENVLFPMIINSTIKPNKRKQEAYRLLEKVGMGHRFDHLPKQLSGGEQQRVAIARALANNPLCILADEPTGNVDAESERNILKLLRDLCNEGRSVIAVTHNSVVADTADEVFYMNKGVLKRRG